MITIENLDEFLSSINPIEEKQKKTGESINDYEQLENMSDEMFIDPHFKVIRFPKEVFFDDKTIFISRHNRFAPMVEHLHDFIEMIYVYKGSCKQTIKGKAICLSQGSFCVLDRDVPHSIEALGEEDILINILINEATFSSLFLYKLQDTTSLLVRFLADAFNEQAIHDQYIIFNTQESYSFHYLIQLMLCEFWSQNSQSQEFLSHYLQLILMELIRIYKDENNNLNSSSSFDYAKIMSYIDANFKELTLAKTAQEFAYNPNYLSNRLKELTGRSFQKILLEKRLLLACDLLKHSNLSTEMITFEAGFKSTSYFFRQFKKYYHQTPIEYRKQHRTI